MSLPDVPCRDTRMSNKVLTREELYQLPVEKLRKYVAERIESLRKQNDADLDPVKTAAMRGRIQEAKLMLTLLSPEPAKVTDAAV